jgi:hypothetical protein
VAVDTESNDGDVEDDDDDDNGLDEDEEAVRLDELLDTLKLAPIEEGKIDI